MRAHRQKTPRCGGVLRLERLTPEDQQAFHEAVHIRPCVSAWNGLRILDDSSTLDPPPGGTGPSPSPRSVCAGDEAAQFCGQPATGSTARLPGVGTSGPFSTSPEGEKSGDSSPVHEPAAAAGGADAQE